MAKTLTQYRVFISCPGDLANARDAIRHEIDSLNRSQGDYARIQLKPVDWKQDVLGDLGSGLSAQRVIETEIGAHDVFLGMMKHRFGSPTEGYGSGTERELSEALALRKAGQAGAATRILFYFSDEPVPQSLLKEAGKVQRFRTKVQKEGLIHTFPSEEELVKQVREHLSHLMSRFAREVETAANAVLARDTQATGIPVDRPSSYTASAIADVLSVITAGDHVIVINYQALLSPPGGLPSWSQLPCGPDRVFTLDGTPIGSRLRDTNLDMAAWKLATEQVDEVVERATRGLEGRLHVFFMGPHALGLFLGRRLEVRARLTDTFIHQFDQQSRAWKLFLLPQSLAGGLDRSSFYHPLTLEARGTGLSGVVLNINATSRATEEQLQALCARTQAREARSLSPQNGTGWMTSLEDSHTAVRQLREAIDELHRIYPSEPVHVCTSAPIALLVGFGRQVRQTVTSSLTFHQYDAPTRRYYPVLDVISGQVADAQRPRLEIVSESDGLQYVLKGVVQRGWRSNLGGNDGIDRRSTATAALRPAIEAFSRHVLPEPLERQIAELETLDIELRLDPVAAKLSWELLELPNTRLGAAILQEGWTLARFEEGRPRDSRPRKAEELKVLIVPALTEASTAEPFLKLANLEADLRSAQLQVLRLPYGVELDRIGDAILNFQPNILHWVGHGGPYSPDRYAPSFHVQAEGRTVGIDYSRLCALLRPARELRLAVLCACKAAAPGGGFDLPGHLLQVGVGAVIGFRDEVGMKEIEAFQRRFYTVLVQGEGIREALGRARNQLHAQELLLQTTFAAPILTAVDASCLQPLVSGGTLPASTWTLGGDPLTSSPRAAIPGMTRGGTRRGPDLPASTGTVGGDDLTGPVLPASTGTVGGDD